MTSAWDLHSGTGIPELTPKGVTLLTDRNELVCCDRYGALWRLSLGASLGVQSFKPGQLAHSIAIAIIDQRSVIVLGTLDGFIRLIDTTRNHQLAQWRVHENAVQGLLSTSENTVISWSTDGRLKCWDPKTESQVWAVNLVGVDGCSMTPGFLLCNTYDGVKILGSDTGREAWHFAFEPDGAACFAILDPETVVVGAISEVSVYRGDARVSTTQIDNSVSCLTAVIQRHFLIGTECGALYLVNDECRILCVRTNYHLAPIDHILTDRNRVTCLSRDGGLSRWEIGDEELIALPGCDAATGLVQTVKFQEGLLSVASRMGEVPCLSLETGLPHGRAALGSDLVGYRHCDGEAIGVTSSGSVRSRPLVGGQMSQPVDLQCDGVQSAVKGVLPWERSIGFWCQNGDVFGPVKSDGHVVSKIGTKVDAMSAYWSSAWGALIWGNADGNLWAKEYQSWTKRLGRTRVVKINSSIAGSEPLLTPVKWIDGNDRDVFVIAQEVLTGNHEESSRNSGPFHLLRMTHSKWSGEIIATVFVGSCLTGDADYDPVSDRFVLGADTTIIMWADFLGRIAREGNSVIVAAPDGSSDCDGSTFSLSEWCQTLYHHPSSGRSLGLTQAGIRQICFAGPHLVVSCTESGVVQGWKV